MKNNRCYICYELSGANATFHPACLKKIFNIEQLPELTFNNQDIEAMALELIKQKKTIPGVQKKLSLMLTKVENDHQIVNRLTLIGYMGGEYILKPPTVEYPFMPEIEDLSMHLADIAKINVAVHSLLPMQDGQLAYITKRFDRKGKRKLAVEDLCQLSVKLTQDKYKSTSEKTGKIIYQYATVPGEEVLKFFELIVFSFLIGNGDMHLKNFSLITDDPENITLAPSYDLLSTRLLISEKHDPEELALPINGKKTNIRKNDFLAFGKTLMIPEKVIDHVIHTMINYIPQWHIKIQQSFLNDSLKEKFQNLIASRAKKMHCTFK